MPFLDIHIHKQEDKYVVNVTENKITMESFVSGLDIYIYLKFCANISTNISSLFDFFNIIFFYEH